METLELQDAVEAAAAGHHHLLMIGPPGCGKTMIARRVPGIMPPMSEPEALEASAVHSAAGAMPRDAGLLRERPFRAPHHTVSERGLVGGGTPPRPGELSLAHHGVLFLDELFEFSRSALDSLFLEARERLALIVAASNQCWCGFAGDGTTRCGCGRDRVARYVSRLSEASDRFDLHVRLGGPVRTLPAFLDSHETRARVATARARQRARFESGETSAPVNGRLGPDDLDRVCAIDPPVAALLSKAIECLGMSACAYAKVRRVARTLADLDGAESVDKGHVSRAIMLVNRAC